ncbi:PTS transporter subunit EIIC [Caldanaerobacter subterraneus]|uniref:PTS transporter subunit EIIC n=1 Tax=Caldanaerobacter subterraneus TaxID=911092 RepID=UPI0034641C95
MQNVNAITTKGGSLRVKLQRLGGFLAGMVIPNIGAFIAWGLITAFFIPTGWVPNEHLAKLVGPMIMYLLPILIGYTGGKLVYDVRGGVVGAVATAGVAIGSSVPMFIGAMIMGPLGGYVIKKFDEAVEGKVPAGFEMLVNNFSAGILGGILAILAFLFVEPVMNAISLGLGAAAQWVTDKGLLPLIALFIEPGKVLFLNNAINHGILAPLGVAQVKEFGKSIFFLLETNPGPGLGVLLAYWLFGTPSPGSIFAEIAMAPKGGLLPVLAGIAVGALVSFLIASPIVKRASEESMSAESMSFARSIVSGLKAQSKGEKVEMPKAEVKMDTLPKLIVFACDAGMGSSAMGETILRKKLKEAGFDIQVKHSAVNQIPKEADVVFTQENLAERAAQVVPHAKIVTVKNFLDNTVYDEFVKSLRK